MMDISERINKREQKKAVASSLTPPPKPEVTKHIDDTFPAQSVGQAINKMTSLEPIDANKVELRPKEQLVGGVDWRSLDYDSAIKFNPELSRSQYISGAAQYRKENNKPGFTNEEMFTLLGGKDPYVSAKQEAKDERRMKTAGYIDSIGNVLANLVNYVRTRNGNPAMNLASLKDNTARLDKLKAYHDALGRSNYNTYMNMLRQEQAREAAQAAAQRKFMQELTLQKMKDNSPLAQSKLRAENERLKGIIADNRYKGLRADKQEAENKYLPTKQAAEMAYMRERTNAARRSSGGKKEPLMLRLKQGDKYSEEEFDINDDKDLLRMYDQGVRLGIYPEYREMDENGEYTKIDLNKMNPDKLRNIILYNSYNYSSPGDADYNKPDEYKRNAQKPKLGWGASSSTKDKDKDNNDLDW